MVKVKSPVQFTCSGCGKKTMCGMKSIMTNIQL